LPTPQRKPWSKHLVPTRTPRVLQTGGGGSRCPGVGRGVVPRPPSGSMGGFANPNPHPNPNPNPNPRLPQVARWSSQWFKIAIGGGFEFQHRHRRGVEWSPSPPRAPCVLSPGGRHPPRPLAYDGRDSAHRAFVLWAPGPPPLPRGCPLVGPGPPIINHTPGVRHALECKRSPGRKEGAIGCPTRPFITPLRCPRTPFVHPTARASGGGGGGR